VGLGLDKVNKIELISLLLVMHKIGYSQEVAQSVKTTLNKANVTSSNLPLTFCADISKKKEKKKKEILIIG
jgi:hypothetical protein